MVCLVCSFDFHAFEAVLQQKKENCIDMSCSLNSSMFSHILHVRDLSLWAKFCWKLIRIKNSPNSEQEVETSTIEFCQKHNHFDFEIIELNLTLYLSNKKWFSSAPRSKNTNGYRRWDTLEFVSESLSIYSMAEVVNTVIPLVEYMSWNSNDKFNNHIKEQSFLLECTHSTLSTWQLLLIKRL